MFWLPSSSLLLQLPIEGLTIRQRQHQWKRCGKIDFASFETFSLLHQVTQILEGKVARLELKRGDSARVQREIVTFIALPLPFSSHLKIWSFRVIVVPGRLRNVQKPRNARANFFLFILFQSLSTLTQTLKKATILIRVIVVPGRHVHKHKKKNYDT